MIDKIFTASWFLACAILGTVCFVQSLHNELDTEVLQFFLISVLFFGVSLDRMEGRRG